MIKNNSIILKYNQYLESGLLQTKFMDYLSQKVNQQKQNDFPPISTSDFIVRYVPLVSTANDEEHKFLYGLICLIYDKTYQSTVDQILSMKQNANLLLSQLEKFKKILKFAECLLKTNNNIYLKNILDNSIYNMTDVFIK